MSKRYRDMPEYITDSDGSVRNRNVPFSQIPDAPRTFTLSQVTAIFGLENNYSLIHVLEKFIVASEHLANFHNCDCHDYETQMVNYSPIQSQRPMAWKEKQ